MTKFSEFINNLGTARDPTVTGISGLGFILSSELPTILGKYLRVDEAQSFAPAEKTQARANIGAVIGTDVQAFSTKLQAFATVTNAANTIAYSTGAATFASTAFTATGRSIVGGANATAVRVTLEIGNVDNTSDADKPVSAAQQAALNLKAPLASPALTGTPTAPTAAAGANTTQIATTAFVQNTAFAGQSIGVNQTWQNVTASRNASTTYQNTTGRPIAVFIQPPDTTATVRAFEASADNSNWVRVGGFGGGVAQNVAAIIPPGWYYRIAGTSTIGYWSELR